MASAAQEQAWIVLEVGDTPDTRVATNVAGIWNDYADKALLDFRLQILYTTVRCIELALGYERGNVDYEQLRALQVKAGQSPDRLLKMKTAKLAEIATLEKRLRARRGGASGAITTTTISVPPESPNAPVPSGYIDANSPQYRGDPYLDPGFGPGSPDQVTLPLGEGL